MKVILTEKVKSLGNIGDIVNVSAGYARNFLFPQGLGVLADDAHKKQLANQQKALAKKVAAERAEAEALKNKVNGLNLELIKKVGASGKLFGSVTTMELSKELGKLGYDVEKRLITLANPIKAVGTFEAKVNFCEGIFAEFSVKVAMDPKQAEEMKLKAEEAAKEKAKAKAEAEAAAAEGEAEGEPKAELTEEQKLKIEADKILRTF